MTEKQNRDQRNRNPVAQLGAPHADGTLDAACLMVACNATRDGPDIGVMSRRQIGTGRHVYAVGRRTSKLSSSSWLMHFSKFSRKWLLGMRDKALLAAFCGMVVLTGCPRAGQTQNVSCKSILEEVYDKSQGLSVWEQFPKIGIAPDDRYKKFFMENGFPLAEALWRFLNEIDRSRTFEVTPHFAMRVYPVQSPDQLWGLKEFYAPTWRLVGGSATPSERDRAASQYLEDRIKNGATIITSYNISIKEGDGDHRVAFISPVLRNIPDDFLPVDVLAASYFTVFTNMRIDDSRLVKQKFLMEYEAGCLQNLTKDCIIFDLGRTMYRHATELKRQSRLDVTEDLCRYLRER